LMAARDCSVCYNSFPVNLFKRPTTDCAHTPDTCDECIKEHLTTLLKGGSVGESTYANMGCPVVGCKATFRDKRLAELLTKKQYSTWEKLTYHASLEALSSFRWCANQTCGNGQITIPEEDTYFKCGKCNTLTCIRHRVAMHLGQSCWDYDNCIVRDQQGTQLWIAQNTKPCPSCGMACTKDNGCDHVKCQCNHEFCWRCLAAFDPIRKKGNHHHNANCTFYAEYNGLDA